MRTAAALVAVLGMLAAGAGYPVYVRPRVDAVRHADAILVLGGSAAGPRYRYGLELARQGWAPTLVLSNPYGGSQPFVDALCRTPQPRLHVECFVPDPHTTLGEGRALRRLARERRWGTVIVVTSVPHVSRARYIIGKCFDGELVMAATPARLGVFGWTAMYVYQTAGYVKSAVQGDC